MAALDQPYSETKLVSYSAARQEKFPEYNIFNISVATFERLFYKNKNMKKAKEQKTGRYEKMPVVNSELLTSRS